MYDNQEFARSRLGSTIVDYKGSLVYVADVQMQGVGRNPTDIHAQVYPIPYNPNKHSWISIWDAGFNFKEFNLGYYNTEAGNAYYLHRVPTRHPKQGLCEENLKFRTLRKDGVPYQEWMSLTSLLTDVGDSVQKMYNNKYPSFSEAMTKIKKIKAIAFSRKLCLFRDELDGIFLCYRGDKIAHLEGKTFRSSKGFKYLEEVIRETEPDIEFTCSA